MKFLKINLLYFFYGYFIGLILGFITNNLNYFNSNNNRDILDIDLILNSKIPVIPKENNIYFLSNSQKNLYVFVKMEYYDTIAYFYYVKNQKNLKYCKEKKYFRSRILQNLADTNREYFAIQNYGNTYFYNINKNKFHTIINNLPDCIL